MKLKLLPIALLAVVSLGLAACDNNVSSSTSTTSSQQVEVETFKISNKDALTAAWGLNQGNRQINFEIVPETNINTAISSGELKITSSNTEVATIANRMIMPQGVGTATISASYGGLTDSVDITISENVTMKLKDVREGIASGDIASGDKVSFNGKITATMAESDIGDGVYVQDGEYALMIYGGDLEKLWGAGDFEIGDTVHVEGSLSPYNGLNEVQPTVFEEVSDTTIAEPTALTITADNFSAGALAGQDGRLFVVEDAKYVDGEVNIGSHSTINFALTNADDVDVTLPVRLNYHTGNDEMNMFKGIVDALEPGDLVDIYGVISWYNLPQLSPQFLADKTVSENIVPVEALANPTAVTITGEDSIATGNSVVYSASITPSNANQAVTWTSSDTSVATVNQYTGSVSPVKEGKFTLTATSRIDNEVKGTKEINVIVDADAPQVLISEAEDGKTYLFGVYQGNTGSTLFANGTMANTYYLGTTTDYNEAIEFTAHKSADGKWSFESEKGYLALTAKDDGSNGANPAYSTTEFLFDYNSTYNTYTAKVVVPGHESEVNTYYIGTYSTYTTLSASAISYAGGSFVGHLYTFEEQVIPPEPEQPTKVTELTAGTYKLGMEVAANNIRYITGEMVSSFYFGTMTDYNKSQNVTVAASGDGWTFQLDNGEYIGAVVSDTHTNNVFQADPYVWNYDATNGIWTVLEGTTVYLGNYGNYTTSIALRDSVDFHCFFYTGDVASVEVPEPTLVTTPVSGQSYLFGLYQEQEATYYYATGSMAGYYMGTTSDYTQAKEIIVTASGEGWILQFEGGKYIGSAQSGTHYNVTLVDTAEQATVWTYNTQYNCFQAVIGDAECWMGTYGQYNTIGGYTMDKISETNQYHAHLYTMDA